MATVPVPWLALAGLAVAAMGLLLGMVVLSLRPLWAATDLVEVRTA